LDPNPTQCLKSGKVAEAWRALGSHHPVQELIAIRPDLAGERCTFAGVLGQPRLVGPQAEKSKVQLSKAIDQNLALIRADDRRIRQVLINLLSNAVKFTPEGGKVRVSSFRTNVGLAIAVSDTGIGMASEEIPKALEEFGQIDSKISRQYAGTGLGLPLAKHLIELHGGTLTIKSEVNVGTTVTIVLPRERIVARSVTPQIVKVTA